MQHSTCILYRVFVYVLLNVCQKFDCQTTTVKIVTHVSIILNETPCILFAQLRNLFFLDFKYINFIEIICFF